MRLAAMACLLCGVVSAQWIKLPTEGVPRGKNGKPNLSAPAPRTAAGKPDLSGMWMIADLNKIVPGGIPYQPWSLDVMKQRQAHELDPHVKCLPSSFPRMYTLPHITKFVQTPKLLLLINEFNASYRQIFLDGRALPVDPQPSWSGYSAAKWDGDTLVVTTNGFRDDLWMDMAGSPLTNSATVVEKLRRPSFGTLEIEATVTDPKAYTKPWTFKLADKLILDTELIDEICLENETSSRHMK